MKFLFLDIDGVLNAHEKLPSGYCGICRQHAERLIEILLSGEAVHERQLSLGVG